MTEKEKALAHVRSVCPELMELSNTAQTLQNKINGIVHQKLDYGEYTRMIDCMHDVVDELQAPHLEHWLMALEGESFRTLTQREEHFQGKVVPDRHLLVWHETGKQVYFDLTTGQPATNADYQAYNQIVGV